MCLGMLSVGVSKAQQVFIVDTTYSSKVRQEVNEGIHACAVGSLSLDAVQCDVADLEETFRVGLSCWYSLGYLSIHHVCMFVCLCVFVCSVEIRTL